MALGAGSLTAGTILGAAPVLAAWLGWRRRSSGAVPAAAAALLMLLGAAAVIAPWTWRNYRVHGGLVPLATNSGSVLYLGNANYERWVDPAAPDRQDLYAAERDAAALTELERYRLFREGAIEWIRENPGKFVLQWCVKFSRMWNPIPRGKGVLLALASVLTHGIVLALALVGAWQGLRRRSPEVGLLAVYLFTISAVHAMFILTQRHRVPLADGFLIVLASGTVTRLIGGYGQGGRPACYSAAAHPGGAG
jgi:hypothetical protein